MKYQTRQERLQFIRAHFERQNKGHIVNEQLKTDPDWDIRGTIQCPICEEYLDYCYAGLGAECSCKQSKEK